jgi:hypothetical protein
MVTNPNPFSQVFVTAYEMMLKSLFCWSVIREEVVARLASLSKTQSAGKHGEQKLGGKSVHYRSSSKGPEAKVYPGRPHFTDFTLVKKLLDHLDSYFSENRPIGEFFDSDICPSCEPVFVPFDDTHKPLPSKNPRDKDGWEKIIPKEAPCFSDLTSPDMNTHLDVLHAAQLLDEYQGSLVLKSKSGMRDMFFLEEVANKGEVYQISVLQGLLILLNLLLSKHNERGFSMVATGIFEGGGWKLRERKQCDYYSDLMKTILGSLTMGYSVMERRFAKWMAKVSGNPNILTPQKTMASKYEAAWGNKIKQVPILQQLVMESWLTAGRGTTIHKDIRNYEFSFAYYVGLGWDEDEPCFGIPELKFLWKHRAGSVMAIRASHWLHMSLPFSKEVKMMNACFLNKKFKNLLCLRKKLPKMSPPPPHKPLPRCPLPLRPL